jgi:hypothetical protein
MRINPRFQEISPERIIRTVGEVSGCRERRAYEKGLCRGGLVVSFVWFVCILFVVVSIATVR